jgi:hypothetical protein
MKPRQLKRSDIAWRYVQPNKVDHYASRGWREAIPQPENKHYVLMIKEPTS